MEWIVGALVVLAFIAIAVRFVPRDDTGRVSLPAIVDDSLGMWALRRLTGLPPWDRRPDVNAAGVAEIRSAANASGSTAVGAGVSIGPTPIGPTRFVASASRLQQIGARPVGSIGRPVSTTPSFTVRFMRGSMDPGRQRHQAVAPLGLQRQLAAIAAVLVVGVVALGIVLAPRASRGGVLGVTGGPALDRGSGDQSSPLAGPPGYGASSELSPSAATSTPDAVNDGVPTPITIAKGAGPTAIAVLANDTAAPDTGETIRITSVTQGSHGTVAIGAGGTTLTYDPAGQTTGPDTFTYTSSDGHGGTDTATVHVNVAKKNKP